ncbi:Lrp/AsnC family transcriptional regulator [Inquilinus limosus]|uniref:Lrp/AsnC family transcriptional regulator n=1 Tax=Inquilinus limosus TaxID=171674 RepID=UPI0003F60686|nr:Lrp/AsnC family transcriptional regulator [Inquilinus limosus]
MTTRPAFRDAFPMTEKLDRIDLRILTELQKSGRITNFKLSELVGISASPCHKRVKRLERMGLIRGYRAEVYWSRLFPSVAVFAFASLKSHGVHDFQMFERQVKAIPEVTSCFGLCGSYDYMLRFDCRDMVAYEAVSAALLAGEIQLSRFDSYVVLREIKDEPATPTAWADAAPAIRRAA